MVFRVWECLPMVFRHPLSLRPQRARQRELLCWAPVANRGALTLLPTAACSRVMRAHQLLKHPAEAWAQLSLGGVSAV